MFSELKCFGFVFDESSAHGKVYCTKMVSRNVTCVIILFVNDRSLQHDCAKVFHEGLFWSKTVLWRNNDRCKLKTVKLDNLIGLFDRISTIRC